jgi:ABC-type bacteriocin/lantibiotic exporter with double-glycine peptidase domain
VYLTYLKAPRNLPLLGIIVSSFLLSNACQILQQWTVGAWTSDASYSRMTMRVYVAGVTSFAAGVAFFTWLRTYLALVFFAKASEVLHNNMAAKVLSAPLNYFGKKQSYILTSTYVYIFILTH